MAATLRILKTDGAGRCGCPACTTSGPVAASEPLTRKAIQEMAQQELDRRRTAPPPAPDLTEAIRAHRAENDDTRAQRLEAFLKPSPVQE